MAIKPSPVHVSEPTLRPFAPEHADLIPDWVRDEQEAYWLAPRSRLPLNARRVMQWGETEGDRFVMVAGGFADPVAYGELNRLARDPGTLWLGHLVVDPIARGHGFGQTLTRLLLAKGFEHGARRVTLVVFPENETAIHAYEKAGLSLDGHETHYFPVYRRSVRLLRMAMTAKTFHSNVPRP